MDETSKKTGPTPSAILSFARVQIEELPDQGVVKFYLCTIATEIDGRKYVWHERIPKDVLISQFDSIFLYGLTELKKLILEKRDEKLILEPGPGAIGPGCNPAGPMPNPRR